MARPTCIVCIGMAGSGKTTFMQRINAHLHTVKEPPYIMNLDPAVRNVPFDSNIDIRDSIDYKEVMRQFNLGPNGGILTSLNLFATKVDQILGILEKRTGVRPDTEAAEPADPANPIKHILVDTPGQIEVFVWSASGQILLSTLASTFPTVLAYIIDTPRTASTSTFMSNMLYACSILYKTKLPMILVFNKTDIQSADFATDWMTDFEAFQAALKKEEDTGVYGGGSGGGPAVGGSGYMSSLLNSMSLVLEEFYKHLSVVSVSSYTGAGVEEFFSLVQGKASEFERDYKPELERRRLAMETDRLEKRDANLGKLMEDLNVNRAPRHRRRPAKEEPETISDMEDEEDDDDEYSDLPEATLVDPDAEEAEDADDGLESRYQRALNQSGKDGKTTSEDMSFVRAMYKSSINR